VPRRYVIAALVVVVLVLLLLVRRSDRVVVPASGSNAINLSQNPREWQRAVRPFHQRPAVTLIPPIPEAAQTISAPAGAFEGRVVSALTQKGLPGAQLTFARAEETSSVAAGSDGAFRFDARVPGRWFLAAATAQGYRPFAPEWGQSPVQLDARPGEVVRGITVALLPSEEYEGHVVDADHEPVAGAEITVLGGGVGATTLVPLDTHYRSDASGAFRFSAPEEAILEARREGFATGRARIDYSVRLSHKLTIQLRATTTSDPLLAIDGVVEDANGLSVEGAAVSASRKEEVGVTPATTRTDPQGQFKLADLRRGKWIVVATRAGAAPASVEALAGATGLRLRLSEGGRLAGRVRDRRTGAPIKLFTVLVQSTDLRSASVIDPAGRYQIEGVAPGPAVVSVIAPGHAPSTGIRVTIPEPGAAPAMLDFDLTAGGRLTGVVVERGTARPLEGAQVEVEGTGASLGVPIRNQTITDSDGKFALGALGETTLGVYASAPAHHARIISVPSIPDGETGEPVTIELTPVAPGEDPRVELVGIGAVLEKRDDVLRIIMVAPGGGAAEAGLGPGDEIVSIDGVLVKPMTLAEAIPLLRGPEGTIVSLRVNKAGDARLSVVMDVPRRLVRG
jgi:hypothetical protein